MDELVSKRIDALRLFCVCMIVGLHVPSQAVSFKVPAWTTFTRIAWRVVPHCFGRAALPLLFVVSGFLFYRTYRNTLQSYLKKIRSRLKSLILPYIVWNIIAFVFLASKHPGILQKWSFVDYINMFFYKMAGRRPLNFPLWFVQQLIYSLFLSPLLYVCYRYIPYLALPISFGLYTWTFYIADPKTAIILRAIFMATTFIGIGAVISMNNIRLPKRPVIDSVLMAVYAYSSVYVNTYISNHDDLILYNLCLMPLGIYSLWSLFRYIPENIIRVMAKLNSHSFIIFAAHFMVLNLFSKFMLPYFLWRDSNGKLAFFFVNMFSTIALCVLLGMLLKRFAPPVFKVLTGWR